MAKSAFAQTPTPSSVPIPTPSVPEFTLKLVGPPYLLNTTYSLDPNTGQIVAKIGYTNPYSALEINVKNQPFVKPFEGGYGNLYYNVRIKDHNATDNWVEAYNANYFFPQQSNGSAYSDVGGSIEDYSFVGSLAGRQVDIQVEAMLGGIFRESPAFASGYEFRGATSVWSNTQTIGIPANTPLSPTPPSSSSPTLTSTPTPVSSAPDSSLLLITTIALVVIAFLMVVIIFLLLYIRKRRIAFSQTNVTPTP
jgi:hypothetical protein